MKNDYDDDREVIIAAHPLLDYCREHGWELRRDGSGRWKCLCPLHQEDTASFTINPEKNLFYCFGCKAGGSVIDLHMRLRGIDKGAAMRELSPNSNKSSNYMKTTKKSTPALDAIPKREVAAYDYQDATGRVRFQVIRYEYMDPATGDTKKTFKQCRIVDGVRDWDSKMDGVERLLYLLPEVVAVGETEVWIVEGEKDVETLRAVKQVATCNPGGAAKWLPAFSQDLKDKCIYLVPDRDKPGEDHARDVLQSLAGIVRWVKWVELPPELKGAPVKDISDLPRRLQERRELRRYLGAAQSQSASH